nr:MAG TPA: hypothetical protein [Caudoviricetes sp.]
MSYKKSLPDGQPVPVCLSSCWLRGIPGRLSFCLTFQNLSN